MNKTIKTTLKSKKSMIQSTRQFCNKKLIEAYLTTTEKRTLNSHLTIITLVLDDERSEFQVRMLLTNKNLLMNQLQNIQGQQKIVFII